MIKIKLVSRKYYVFTFVILITCFSVSGFYYYKISSQLVSDQDFIKRESAMALKNKLEDNKFDLSVLTTDKFKSLKAVISEEELKKILEEEKHKNDNPSGEDPKIEDNFVINPNEIRHFNPFSPF